jgi:SNF2 family DNA or RNA helicase
MKMSVWKKYGFAWLTVAFFLFSFAGHWLFGWIEYVHEQVSHGESPDFAQYLVVMLRDTFENWQSEFLQLFWQVLGLTYFLYVGSPQSKEEDDRFEDKLDAVLRKLDPQGADALIQELDRRYPGRYVGPKM